MNKLQNHLKPCCDAIGDAFQIDILRALSDPMRLNIISELADRDRPVSVSGLTNCCGIDFSGVSRHLKLLREAGLVEATKQGRETRYTLKKSVLASQLRAMATALER